MKNHFEGLTSPLLTANTTCITGAKFAIRCLVAKRAITSMTTTPIANYTTLPNSLTGAMAARPSYSNNLLRSSATGPINFGTQNAVRNTAEILEDRAK